MFFRRGKFFSVTGGEFIALLCIITGGRGGFPPRRIWTMPFWGINKDKTTHTPAIIPDTSPLAFFLQAAKRMITWEAKQQFPGGESRAAMPEGNWLRIQAATVAQGVIPTEADYKPQASSGKTRFVTKHTVAESAWILGAPRLRKFRREWAPGHRRKSGYYLTCGKKKRRGRRELPFFFGQKPNPKKLAVTN